MKLQKKKRKFSNNQIISSLENANILSTQLADLTKQKEDEK